MSTRWGEDHWHHIVALIDNSIPKIYVDGVLSSIIRTSSAAIIKNTSDQLIFGYNHTLNGSTWFTGKLDDIRFYNFALNDSEILNLFHENGWDGSTHSPNQPNNPSPVDGAINIDTGEPLLWECSDPDGDPLTYDIYLGTESTPPLLYTDRTGTTYEHGGLQENSTYYWKITARDNSGLETTSPIWNFTTKSESSDCPPSVTYAGKTYNTVQIGDQCWLKENLDVGTMIESNSSGFLQTDNGVIEKYCYDNDPANCEIYGGLYEWPEAMQYETTEGAKGICPDGWHIPNLAEFETLKDYVNNQSAALIDESETLEYAPTVTQNETGFSALFAGNRGTIGYFGYAGANSLFWSSTEGNSNCAYNMYLSFGSSNVRLLNYDEVRGSSVRCVQD